MRLLDSMRFDARLALRMLRRERVFATGVVLTFALAIGATSAMLALVTRLLLSPPPGIRDPQSVMKVALERTGRDGETFVMGTTSFPVATALSELSSVFAATAAVRLDTIAVGTGAALEQSPVIQASGGYFTTLGARPTAGRLFGPADDVLPAGNPVVVLGHGYWTRKFARDAAIIGRELVLDGQPFTVIGVAERGFNGDVSSTVDLFVPLSAAMRSRGAEWISEPGFNLVRVLARLAPGATAAVASRRATTALAERGLLDASDPMAAVLFESVVPGATTRGSPRARISLWLTGVATIVLLVAIANVGTLLLLRTERRRREVAIRLALGAGRGAIARSLLLESLLLATLGGLLGIVLARWFGDLMRITLLPDVARDERLGDPRVLALSLALALVAGLLAALPPILRTGRRDVAGEIRSGGGHGASARLRAQRLLVGVQVALCMVLLVGAGLFVRSLERVRSQELGFSTHGLLFITLDVQGAIGGADRDRLHEELVDRLVRSGLVRRASVVQAMPFGHFHVPPISIPGYPGMPNVGGQPPYLYGATPEYLAMMGVTAREGRLLLATDGAASAPVALVNETMARTVWPGESAIGKCIRAGHGGNPDDPFDNATLPCRTVVGVVRDSRARSLRPDGNETRFMQYYVPFEQLPSPPFPDIPKANGILAQVDGDAARAAAPVRRLLQEASALPLYARVRPYQSLIDPQLRSWRLGAILFSVFGALALGIAAVGLFGVVSYLVTQRTREIGVRRALGASAPALRRMVVLDALRLVLAGLVVGTFAAIAAAPLVRSLLFDTSPWEPASLAGAIGVLLAVTVVASLWPAWRAGRVDPLVALREHA